MVVDHVGMRVSQVAASRAFYEQCLAPLGIRVLMEDTGYVGFGRDHVASFWIGEAVQGTSGLHLAFSAGDRSQVDAFYAAALAAGGECNGAPGIRAHYHADYYAAFVIDPDGNNIEAVCHRPD